MKAKLINLKNGIITREVVEKIENMDIVKNRLTKNYNIILQIEKDAKLPNDCSWLFSNTPYTKIIFKKGIDTSNVTNMKGMFKECYNLTNVDGLEYFDTSNVTNMSRMFDNSNLRNVDISNFNYDKVEDISWMFASNTNLSKLDGIDILKDKIKELSWVKSDGVLNCTPKSIETDYFELTDIYPTFGITIEPDKSHEFDKIITINKGEMSNTSIQKILSHISNYSTLTQSHNKYKLVLGENIKLVDSFRKIGEDGIFYNIDDGLKFNIESIEFKPGVDSSTMKDMSYMFKKCKNLKEIKGLEYLETKNVTNMKDMFSYCCKLQSLDLSNFNTSNVTNMEFMFNDCRSLETLDVSSFDTSKVTEMYYMFNENQNIQSLDLSNFDTSNVRDMEAMFKKCSRLQSLDLSSFDTNNVVDMDSMFSECTSLKNLDLSTFTYRNVEYLNYICEGCVNLYNIIGYEKLSKKVNELDSLDSFKHNSNLIIEELDIDINKL